MRRKDREITDKERIYQIIAGCDCCRLGFSTGKSAYIVPLNFGYDREQNAFYFHGAQEGRKIDLIRQNGYAGFELDKNHELLEEEKACEYSFRYQSVIGEGAIRILEDPEEKRHGFDCIMKQMTGRDGWEYPEAAVRHTAVLRLDVTEMSAKEKA